MCPGQKPDRQPTTGTLSGQNNFLFRARIKSDKVRDIVLKLPDIGNIAPKFRLRAVPSQIWRDNIGMLGKRGQQRVKLLAIQT